MRSAPSIGFDYHPSRWPRRGTWLLTVLAMMSLALSGLSVASSMALGALALGYAFVSARKCRTSRVRSLIWRADGGWLLRLDDDQEVEGRLLSARHAGSSVFLRLAWEPQHVEALALLPDNLDAQTRRRLRMRLSAISDTT
ncbi:hypothetical protein [Oleiagrimonas sp.]|jgi:toxin CptA|uniref:hypothetical protein n=1 Tax=Oleiagrimonas sp. TaxID=2010330 RepID=UPI002607A9C9|nr:hypothetical protein [Oleiagrimonas sp.]